MKKLKTIALLIVVLLIWGKITWDVFFQDDTVEYEQTAQVQFEKMIAQEGGKPKYELQEIVRDPFLGKSTSSVPPRQKTVKKVVKLPSVQEPKKEIVWPTIAFQGYVKDNSNGSPKAFVKVNDQFSTWTEGDSLQELVLAKVFKDSIIVSYADQTKAIKKLP